MQRVGNLGAIDRKYPLLGNVLRKMIQTDQEQDNRISRLLRNDEIQSSHADLRDLDFASSGHTGFASQASLDTHIADTSTHGVTGDIIGDGDSPTCTGNWTFNNYIRGIGMINTGSMDFNAGAGSIQLYSTNAGVEHHFDWIASGTGAGVFRVSDDGGTLFEIDSTGNVKIWDGAFETALGTMTSDVAATGLAWEFDTSNARTTGNLFEFRDNNSAKLWVNDNFNLVLASGSGIYASNGLDEGTYDNHFCSFQNSYTGTATKNQYGVFTKTSIRPANDSAFDFYGLICESAFDSSTASRQIGTVYGAYVTASWSGSAASRDVSEGMYGGRFVSRVTQTGTTPATLDNCFGGDFGIGITGTNLTCINTGAINVRAPTVFGAKSGTTTIQRCYGMQIGNMSGSSGFGTVRNAAIYIVSQSCNDADEGNIWFAGGDYNTGHLRLENGHVWNDATNNSINVSGNAPTSTTDGFRLFDNPWLDANIGAAVFTQPAASIPDVVNFFDEGGGDTGIASYGFAVGEKISGYMEIPHGYKEGSDITFHVHWQGNDAPTGTDKVQWQLDYTVMKTNATLDATTQITIETDIDTQYEGMISAFAAIDGTNYEIGDQFLFTLERIAASANEYAGDAVTATVGLHYQADSVGSDTITGKS